jgi:hypothetical protein
MISMYSTFSRPTGRRSNVKDSVRKKETQKGLIDSVAISKKAVFACYLLTRLGGLLILQSAQRPVSREKALRGSYGLLTLKGR